MQRQILIALAVLALMVLGIAILPTKQARHVVPCRFAPPFQFMSMNPIVVQLEVFADGHVTWNGSPVDHETLVSYFNEAAQVDPQPAMIVIPHDWQTPYATVAPVVRLMHDKKAYWIWLETPRSRSGPPYLRASVQCDTRPSEERQLEYTDDIEIMRDGRTLWNGRFVSREELAKMLDRDVRTAPQPLIQLAIAPDAPQGKVADIMLDVQWSGITRMTFEAD